MTALSIVLKFSFPSALPSLPLTPRVFLDKAGSARLKPLNDPVPLDACPSLDVAPIASIPPSPRPDRASSIPSQEPACLSLSLDMNPLGLALQEEGLSALLKFFPASSFSLETAPFARTKTSLFFRAGRWRKDRDDDCATFESLSVQVFPDVDVQSPARLRAFFQSIKPAVIAAAQSDHLQKALGIATLPEGLGLVTRWYPESASTATMPRSKVRFSLSKMGSRRTTVLLTSSLLNMYIRQ